MSAATLDSTTAGTGGIPPDRRKDTLWASTLRQLGKKRVGEARPFSFDPGAGLVCDRIGNPHIADGHFRRGQN
jgi:hypothetical protein